MPILELQSQVSFIYIAQSRQFVSEGFAILKKKHTPAPIFPMHKYSVIYVIC